MPTSSLQRRGFYKLLPYNEALIDSTASCLALSPFLVEYATLFHPTTKFSTLSYPELRLDRLLKEKLPLRGIARVTGISGTWLQRYVNRLYEKQGLEPQPVKKREVVFRMLRQRVSRLVRKTFSKKLENHIGAIIYFINHYNKSLLLLHYSKSFVERRVE